MFIQISDAIVVLSGVRVAHELAVIATEDDSRAIDLMLEDVGIWKDFFASTVTVAALEFYLG